MPLAQDNLRSGTSSGKQAVFRWTEEGGLRADQEDCGAFERQIVQPEAEDGHGHYEEFH